MLQQRAPHLFVYGQHKILNSVEKIAIHDVRSGEYIEKELERSRNSILKYVVNT